MTNKVKTTVSIAPETDYEIRRLAKIWKVPIAQVWEICCHYTAQMAGPYGAATTIANIRQAEAKAELLKQ